MWLFLIHPADNRSAGRAHRSLRCVWSKERGMWFGVKVLISWCFCLQSSWIVLYVFLWQEQAQQLCTSSFYNVNCSLSLHSSHIFVTADIRNRVLFVARCPHSFCREEKVGWAPLLFLLSQCNDSVSARNNDNSTTAGNYEFQSRLQTLRIILCNGCSTCFHIRFTSLDR